MKLYRSDYRFPRPAQITGTLLLALIVATALPASGAGEPEDPASFRIGVFVPGVVDGSPTYEMMVDGVTRAATESRAVEVTVIEGGFNQGLWGESVMSMAASGDYDVIVTSNPSMPEIAAEVIAQVPDVSFVVLDGYLSATPRLHTVLFNQREQAYLSGYFAGLVTTAALPDSNDARRVGLLAGQEYPIMNDVILVAYQEGADAAAAGTTVDFRVLGNWFDAARAQEIVTDMISQGADAVLTIAGGGNQGAIAAARERGAYVLWYDDTGYDQAPGIVLGSSVVRQDQAAYEATRAAIDGTLAFGEARILGVADGAVGFDMSHPAFVEHVPADIAAAMGDLVDRLERGELTLPMATGAQ